MKQSETPSAPELIFPPQLIKELREAQLNERAQLATEFRRGLNVNLFLRRSSRCVDRLLQQLWQRLPLSLIKNSALIAIGGYGRQALCPQSDIDLMIALAAPPSASEQQALVAFETILWDLGLHIGHRVHLLEELQDLQQWDIATQTALIEYRYLCGSRNIYRRYEEKLVEHFDFASFFEAKRFEQEQRYLKYKDVVYNLEPNVKEGPGGLRDIHLIRWIEKAAHLGVKSETLVRKLTNAEFLTSYEQKLLRQQENVLHSIRVHLHLLAHRCEDRLLFDHQNTLADILSLKPTAERLAGEVLMQRYFRAAQTIRRLNMLFMQTVSEFLHPLPVLRTLDDDFIQRGALLDVHDRNLFLRKPDAIWDTFLHWQKHSDIETLSANTLRALNEAAPLINARFRNENSNKEKFVAFLRGGHAITHGTRIMNLYGLLGRYLPDFGRIVGQMQHDLFHIYTVDEHTLLAVRNLRRYSLNAHAHEYPLLSRLMMDFARQEVLYFAALFHDIGKGLGGDHSELGAVIARRFCRRHHLPKEDADLIVWLVRNHLCMSHVSQKADISNPDTVKRFAKLVGNERRLIALYLLTTSDIRATSPKIWNPWRAQLLETLFFATRALFQKGKSHDSIEEKQESVRNLIKDKLPADAEVALWRTLNPTYFRRHTVDELAWHISELHACWHAPTPCVRARRLPNNAGLQFLVYVHDMRGLFARLCIFFGLHSLNILEAQISTTSDGFALDSFIVQTDDCYLLSSNTALTNLCRELQNQLQEPPLMKLPTLGKQSRRLRHYPLQPQVRFSEGGNHHDYVLEITVGDRAGLLAHIASLFFEAGVSIKSAHINTMDERVEDVFVLDEATLQSPEARAGLELKLQTMLE